MKTLPMENLAQVAGGTCRIKPLPIPPQRPVRPVIPPQRPVPILPIGPMPLPICPALPLI
ncbi:hypothetical protein [Pelagibacterium lacus]|uniref:Uncharacterized protein n=1 Tax=Pelagibacterium lacus TaxID=2282655 RepID=A0A369VZ16_9HYPH|nr:hypothetical protein [Pelagibacterium lacus]RDE07644.1 hypothetical protein DVH29_15630 [Pelagibacterium lacus]